MDRTRIVRAAIAPMPEETLPPGAGIGFALVISIAFWGLVAAFFF